MLHNKALQWKTIFHRAFGKNPSSKVVYRFLIDHRVTKRELKIRKKKQLEKWNHYGKYRLAHVTLFSAMNVGDNVLSECIRVLFERFYGSIEWQLISIFDKVDDYYIDKVNQCDGVIIGGHGAFLPDTNPNDISGWEWVCAKEQYLQIKTPLFVFAIGYNYFDGQNRKSVFEDNIRSLIERADFFGLRNSGSIREIQSFIDSSLADKPVLQPCATMMARFLFPELPEKKVTRKIAFNVALDRADKRMGDKEEIILSQIAHAMKLISERGYEVHFVTHCDWEIRFIQYLDREDFQYKYHHATMWETDRILNFYNEMDMVIGMRGHGIWIPYGVNCHILALGNQNKTKWFLEDIDAPDWGIDIKLEPEHLSEQILEKFVQIHELDGEKTTKRLLNSQKRLWETTCSNMDSIQKYLGNR